MIADTNLESSTDSLDTNESPSEYQDVGMDSGSEINLQVEEASERLSNFPEIQSENWEQLDEIQRLETLQNVEDQMAEIQGRPALLIQPTDLPANTFGQYDGKNIQINSNTIMDTSMPVNEFVDTIVHEGRHAYQDYAIQNPGFETDLNKVDQWAENFEPGNYLAPEEFGQEIYMNQPVEADAWGYASRITSVIYPNTSKNGA
jgi:hypothetical protein